MAFDEGLKYRGESNEFLASRREAGIDEQKIECLDRVVADLTNRLHSSEDIRRNLVDRNTHLSKRIGAGLERHDSLSNAIVDIRRLYAQQHRSFLGKIAEVEARESRWIERVKFVEAKLDKIRSMC